MDSKLNPQAREYVPSRPIAVPQGSSYGLPDDPWAELEEVRKRPSAAAPKPPGHRLLRQGSIERPPGRCAAGAEPQQRSQAAIGGVREGRG